MSLRDYTSAIARELEDWPGVKWSMDTSGRHGRVTLEYGERSRFMVIPISPSDSRRGIHNMKSVLRRLLREIGAEKRSPLTV